MPLIFGGLAAVVIGSACGERTLSPYLSPDGHKPGDTYGQCGGTLGLERFPRGSEVKVTYVGVDSTGKLVYDNKVTMERSPRC